MKHVCVLYEICPTAYFSEKGNISRKTKNKESLTMDPQCSLQDVIRCNLCETPVPSEHCENCNIHLCKTCVGEHVSDESKDHYIIPFEIRGTVRMCKKHSTETCKRFCKTCNIPICQLCVSSRKHRWHKKKDVIQVYERKKEVMKKDLRDLEKSIYPKFHEAASKIQDQRAYLMKSFQRSFYTDERKDTDSESIYAQFATDRTDRVLTILATIMQKMMALCESSNARYLTRIYKQEVAINQLINQIKMIILKLNSLQDNSDICAVLEYNSKNEEFRSLYNKFKLGHLCYIAARKSGVYK